LVAVGVVGAIALLAGMAYACVSLMRLPADSRGKTIFWLYGLDQDARAKDLLVDEDAQATWARLTEQERAALLAWANKPSAPRKRATRQRDATRALQLGGAEAGLAQPTALETILTSLPWSAS